MFQYQQFAGISVVCLIYCNEEMRPSGGGERLRVRERRGVGWRGSWRRESGGGIREKRENEGDGDRKMLEGTIEIEMIVI